MRYTQRATATSAARLASPHEPVYLVSKLMINLDELEQLKHADVARNAQAVELMAGRVIALSARLPGFFEALSANFVAEANNYNNRQLSQAAKIEIDASADQCLTLSRRAVAPYGSVGITCVQRDSLAELICKVDGYGANGEPESTLFRYTLKTRGIGIGVFERDQLSTPERIVWAVMRQFLYYLL
jgi:hypothetical protein